MTNKQYIWMDGKFIDYDKANVHIMTHSMQYGSGIFEGIRAYETAKGPAIFRLNEHAKRLVNTSRIVGMELNMSVKEVADAIVATVKKNKLKGCYIRPFAFYNDQRIGVNPVGKKVSVTIIAMEFGNYFQGKNEGIRCKVSSWHRMNSSILPPEAKASGNYINSVLAGREAKSVGCDEAILLSGSGHVAEGAGENIFLVEDGKLATPGRESDILMGITRDSIIKIAESMGLEVEERAVHREELYTADEVFFTGTGAELTPIIAVDMLQIGNGKPGPISTMLSKKYSSVVHGEDSEYKQWLTYF